MVIGKLDDSVQVAVVFDEETFIDPNEDGASTILVRGILGVICKDEVLTPNSTENAQTDQLKDGELHFDKMFWRREFIQL